MLQIFSRMIWTALGGASSNPTDPERQGLLPWQLDKESTLQQIHGILPGSAPADLTVQAELERQQASFTYEECFELARTSYSISPSAQLSPQAVDAIACIAAKLGNKTLIQSLLNTRAITLDTSFPGAPGATMLYFAVANKQKSLARFLMTQERTSLYAMERDQQLGYPRLPHSQGLTPFHMAVWANDFAFLQEMLNWKFKGEENQQIRQFNMLNFTMRQLASYHPDKEIFNWIDEAWRNQQQEPQARTTLEWISNAWKNQTKEPPLCFAARIGDIAQVSTLLQQGHDIHSRTIKNFTPLCLAAANGYTPVVELLLREGANPNVPTERGNTPLEFVAYDGYTEIARLLLAYGASVHIANADGLKQPLFIAAANNQTGVAEALLQNGADVNAPSSEGDTPLHAAVSRGHVGTVGLLLAQQGCNVDAVNASGYTPLSMAVLADKPNIPVINALIAHGASISIQFNFRNNSYTAFSYVSQYHRGLLADYFTIINQLTKVSTSAEDAADFTRAYHSIEAKCASKPDEKTAIYDSIAHALAVSLRKHGKKLDAFAEIKESKSLTQTPHLLTACQSILSRMLSSSSGELCLFGAGNMQEIPQQTRNKEAAGLNV